MAGKRNFARRKRLGNDECALFNKGPFLYALREDKNALLRIIEEASRGLRTLKLLGIFNTAI